MRVMEFIAGTLSNRIPGHEMAAGLYDSVSLGLYAGITLTYIYLVFTYRKGECEMPPVPVSILLYCALALLLMEEFLTLLGSPSPAPFRLALGLVAGCALTVILFTSISMGTLSLPTYRRVLSDFVSILPLALLLTGAFYLAGLSNTFALNLMTVTATLGVLILFTSINLYGLFCLGSRRPTPEEKIRIGFMVMVSIVMTINELLLLGFLRGLGSRLLYGA